MTPEELRSRQVPLKSRYRAEPAAALATYRVVAELDLSKQLCRMNVGRGPVVEAGLHPLAGGDAGTACAAEMLLESLAACAGVTAGVVATALRLKATQAQLVVEGDVDFRGTLGISPEVPVGFLAIRMTLTMPPETDAATCDKLAQSIDRHCVVLRSLAPMIPTTLRCLSAEIV